MIHLDTNFLILALRSGGSEENLLRGWLAANELLGISSIAWAEFLCGPLTASDKRLAESLFDAIEFLLPEDAEKGAGLFNATGRRSRTLADCLVAAVAMRCNARLATGNRGDFSPFISHGLKFA